MKYVGVDLTSAFTNQPRAIDVAIITDNSERPVVSFHQVHWPGTNEVIGRDHMSLYAMLRGPLGDDEDAIFAVDGPQGLATNAGGRVCERVLGTPGRTPITLPPTRGGGPFQCYIRSSVDLFNSLVRTPLALVDLNGGCLGTSTLFEVFPGSEWTVLAGRRLAPKATPAGRQQRRALFDGILHLPQMPRLPTSDQLDALVAAYLAWCTRNRLNAVRLEGQAVYVQNGELMEGRILHASRPGPCVAQVLAAPAPDAAPVAADEPVEMRSAEDWVDDELRLFLKDYGVVWGNEPENAWMQPAQNYMCETIAPHPVVRFQLTYAPTVSGGLGWTSQETVKPLLRQLNLPTPDHLDRANGIMLRIRLIP